MIEILHKFRTIKSCFTLYQRINVLGWYKFKCFLYPAKLSCVSYSIDICTVAIKNRNMHAVSTNKIAHILDFNYKGEHEKTPMKKSK